MPTENYTERADRMPIHAEFFLPARQTDLIAVRNLDLDALHRALWATANRREMNRVKRPTVNNYVVAMLIAQGRARRMHGRFYMKDPQEWDREAVDFREVPTPPGRWRCQFCGQDYERPAGITVLVACWTCSELIGLRSYFLSDLWDENRDLLV
jgi:hypothetical protein